MLSDIDHHAALAELGDPASIRDLFEREIGDLATGRLALEGVAIRRFSPRSDGSCLVQYDVELQRPHDGRRERQVWVGLGEPSVERERLQDEALQARLVEPALGPPLHRLRDPELLLWVFPNDPVLTGLAELWDRRRLGLFLEARRDAFRLPDGVRVRNVETEAVKYVGTERCTLRHEIALTDGSTRVVFSKITDDLVALRSSFDAMSGLHAALGATAVLVPEPYLLEPALPAVFAPGLAGRNADERLAELDLGVAGSQIGVALATLHQCEIEGLPGLPNEELCRRLPRALAALSALGDEHRARADVLSARLAQALPNLTQPPPRPVHGAFRLSQLLVTPGGLGLVDFDSCARGDPLFDVGSFVAYLIYLGHKGKLAPEKGAACIRSFCHAYADSAPWGLPRDLMRWHVAAQLFTKHARRSASRRSKKGKPEGAKRQQELERVAQLLDAAAAILAGEHELAEL